MAVEHVDESDTNCIETLVTIWKVSVVKQEKLKIIAEMGQNTERIK